MIFITKVLLIVLGLTLILKGVLEEDFNDLLIGMFVLIVGIGLEPI